MNNRVVITGVGVVAPNGLGKSAFWQALMQGLSGVRPIRRFDATSMTTRIAGEVEGFDPLAYLEPHELKKLDRSSLYAIAASAMAMEDAGLDLAHEDLERIGSSVGNAVGGVDYVDKEIDVLRERGPRWTSPYLAIAFFPCATNGLLSIRWGLKGVVLTLCNGNTSGTDAIGLAYRTIQSGRADVMFAGGTEAPLVPLMFGSLAKDGYLSQNNATPSEAVRPFDSSADGMVLAEGSGMLILESLDHALARGAHLYAEIVGYAGGNSAFDVLRSDTNGWGIKNTMKRAMTEARAHPEHIDVVHGQGDSFIEHDTMETRCIWETFEPSGQHPMVTAVSSLIGNSIGALGAVQAAASTLMIDQGAIPAVANFRSGAPQYPVAIVSQAVRRPVQLVLQNSFCFLGKSSTLILKAVAS